MHYSEQIAQELVNNGWVQNPNGYLEKKFENVAVAGELSDGARYVNLKFCDRERYLEAFLGFDTITDIDGREYANDPVAGAKEIEEKVKKVLYK